MNRFYLMRRALPFAAVLLMLGLAAFNAGAGEELTWPVETDLVYQDGDIVDLWHDAGDVVFLNTRDELKIDIATTEEYKIIGVSILIVQNETDFLAHLDKRGKPKPNKFPFKTDYLGDYSGLADSHSEVISLDELKDDFEFKICWGMNPEQCPPNFYTVVHVQTQKMKEVFNVETESWEWVPDGRPGVAYALGNPGTFDRYPGTESEVDGAYWGYYVTYPLAKIELGHFFDAIVNGLDCVTVTQDGTTGDNGQGLGIVKDIADLYGGSLVLSKSDLGGLKAAIELPAVR